MTFFLYNYHLTTTLDRFRRFAMLLYSSLLPIHEKGVGLVISIGRKNMQDNIVLQIMRVLAIGFGFSLILWSALASLTISSTLDALRTISLALGAIGFLVLALNLRSGTPSN